MKLATFSKSAVLGLAMLLSTGAFASAKGSLHLSNAVTVNGTTLKAGDYRVAWDGNGPSVDVSIMRGKDVIAKLPAQVVELKDAPSDDAAVTTKNESGPNNLAGLRFGGKKMALEFGTDGMKAGAGSQ